MLSSFQDTRPRLDSGINEPSSIFFYIPLAIMASRSATPQLHRRGHAQANQTVSKTALLRRDWSPGQFAVVRELPWRFIKQLTKHPTT